MAGLIVFGVLALIALAVVAYFIGIYNGLIRLRRETDRTWSNIDVILKQRHDEIPKLVEVCKGFMQHERTTLEKVIQARAQATAGRGSVGERSAAENELGRALMSLFAVAENYPELKSNQHFLGLQRRITELEEQISDRRELYNASTTNFNVRIEQIPDVLVARSLGYVTRELYQIDAADRKDVAVSFA